MGRYRLARTVEAVAMRADFKVAVEVVAHDA